MPKAEQNWQIKLPKFRKIGKICIKNGKSWVKLANICIKNCESDVKLPKFA